MITLMGGSDSTEPYKLFQELCVKSFLVSRQYAERIVHLVSLMLDSGLPCFKGQITISNLRNRFHLDIPDVSASRIMKTLIANSYENRRTVLYDQFQKFTNGEEMKTIIRG